MVFPHHFCSGVEFSHNFTPQLRYTLLCVFLYLPEVSVKNIYLRSTFCDVFGRSLVWLYVETEDMSVIKKDISDHINHQNGQF